MGYEYNVFVRRYLVPTNELNSKGNPKCIPIVVRKMSLTKVDNVYGPEQIRVVRYIRGEEAKYSASQYVPPHPDKCSLLKLRPDPPGKFKKIDTFTEEQCLNFLTIYLGSCAVCALHELITNEPDNDLPEDWR
jgi:hypothetical protein